MATRWSSHVAVLFVSLLLLAGCASRDSAPDADSRHREEPHFGDRMDGIGRRFERLGRAGIARRWEFARYQAHEIRESVEELRGAPVPEDLEGLDVARLVQTLLAAALPQLDSALARQDSTAFADAFRRMAEECNACHTTARRQFIEVPVHPGAEVPVLTPLGL